MQAVSIDLSISASMCVRACVCVWQAKPTRESELTVVRADEAVVASLLGVSVVCFCETRSTRLNTR